MNQVQVIDRETQLAPSSVMTPMEMLDRAIASGASIEILEKLMALQERYEKNQARKAFDAAVSAAKGELPIIVKNREVDFTSQKGRTHYKHEDLAEVVRTITPILARHGLSHRFRTSSPPNEPVVCTCIISHRDGHFEENTLSAGRDDTGNKNPIQAIGSTITYLQRMTLKAALGLAASDDDDGRAATNGETIDAQQIEWLQTCIVDVGADLPKFLKFMKVEQIGDIPKSRYSQAIDMLSRKKAQEAKHADANS